MKTKGWKAFGKQPKPRTTNVLIYKKGKKNKESRKGFAVPIFSDTSIFELAAQQEGSTMISEKDYKPMKCCICGTDMPTIHHTNNPSPLTPNTTAKMALEEQLPHRCCSKCTWEKVIPARHNNKSYYTEKDKFYAELGISPVELVEVDQ